MKKKILFTLLLLTFTFKVNAKEEYIRTTTINVDGSGSLNLNINYQVNTEFLKKYNLNRDDLFDNNTYDISLSSRDFKISPLTTNLGSGIEITKTYGDIKAASQSKDIKVDFTDITGDKFNDKILFKRKFGIFYTTYVGNFVFDYSNVKGNKEKDVTINDIKKMVISQFELNIPNKIKSSNATTINHGKKSLTWDLVIGKKNEVKFEFKVINMTSVIIALFIAIVSIIIASIFIIKTGSKKVAVLNELMPKKEKKVKVKKEKKFKKKYNNGFDKEDSKKSEEDVSKKHKKEEKKEKNQETEATIKPQIITISKEPIENQNDLSNKQPVNNEQPQKQKTVENNMLNQATEPIENQRIIKPDLMAPQKNQMANQNNLFNRQPVNAPVNNNQIKKPDLMAPQKDLMANQNNLFNKQPVNAPVNNNQQGETPDYTNVFNQTFDDINRNK